jgi:hypothetical protein
MRSTPTSIAFYLSYLYRHQLRVAVDAAPVGDAQDKLNRVEVVLVADVAAYASTSVLALPAPGGGGLAATELRYPSFPDSELDVLQHRYAP